MPARASFSYYTSSSTFETAATTAGDTLSGVLDFATPPGLIAFGSVANSEYIDPATGVEFIGYGGNQTTVQPLSLSGTTLQDGPNSITSGNSLEIILPANVFALGFTLATTSAGTVGLL